MFKFYCQLEALEWLYKVPEKHPLHSLSSEHEMMHAFIEQLTYNKELILNVTNGEHPDHPIIRQLYELFLQSLIDVNFEPEIFENIQESRSELINEVERNWGAFFIKEDEELVSELEKETGMLFLGANDDFFWKYRKLSKEGLKTLSLDNIKVSSEKSFGWELFCKIAHPFSTLILVDRYILSSEYGLKENLLPLFKNMFDSFDKRSSVKALIFTEEVSTKFKSKEDIEKQIKEYVLNETNLENFECSIVEAPKNTPELHDRRIITDYLLIKSGNSFTYLKKNQVNVNTEIDVFSVLDSSTFESVKNQIKDLKKIDKNNNKLFNIIDNLE